MAELSWWGWGYAEAAVDGAELESLARRVSAFFPLDGAVTPVPDLAGIHLQPPRVNPPAALAASCTDDDTARAAHTYGKAYRDVVRALSGDLANAPDLVAYPRSEQDVVDLLDWAADADLAVVPFGGGTSVVGGVECRERDRPVVCLDLRSLAGVVEVDEVNLAARILAGTTGPAVQAGLKPYGLVLRHYPQSYEFSTVGGWLATRAGGHYATGSTRIDDVVEAIRMVTPVGIAETNRVPSSGAGPNPDRLWLGSEGTLGVISEAWLRVQRPPAATESAAVSFTGLPPAADAVREILASGLRPANCRVLDPLEAMLGANVTDGTSRLLLAFESPAAAVELEQALRVCADHGGRTVEKAAAQQWRDTFVRAPYLRDGLVRLGVVVETFETACTWSAFPALHAAVLSAFDGTGAAVACRFAYAYVDGPAPYFTVYAPARRGSEVEQWDELKARASEALASHGATITHHHAVGRDHRPWYDRERPEPFAVALRAAKAALDPRGILNPGVLL